MTSDRFPGHQGIRFSQVVVGGFSPVEESLLPARQGQAARLSVRTPFCKPAFDLALDAKNSLSGSAKVGIRHPLALWVFTRVFLQPSRLCLARVHHSGVISRCRFSLLPVTGESAHPQRDGGRDGWFCPAKLGRINEPRKRESPATATNSPGPCSADSINRADQRCRYAKLNRKSPPDQSAIPSRGGVCDRLNPVKPPLFPAPLRPGAKRPLVYTRKLIHLQERQGFQRMVRFSTLRAIRGQPERNATP